MKYVAYIIGGFFLLSLLKSQQTATAVQLANSPAGIINSLGGGLGISSIVDSFFPSSGSVGQGSPAYVGPYSPDYYFGD